MKRLGRMGVRKVSPRKATVWGRSCLTSRLFTPSGRTKESPASPGRWCLPDTEVFLFHFTQELLPLTQPAGGMPGRQIGSGLAGCSFAEPAGTAAGPVALLIQPVGDFWHRVWSLWETPWLIWGDLGDTWILTHLGLETGLGTWPPPFLFSSFQY